MSVIRRVCRPLVEAVDRLGARLYSRFVDGVEPYVGKRRDPLSWNSPTREVCAVDGRRHKAGAR